MPIGTASVKSAKFREFLNCGGLSRIIGNGSASGWGGEHSATNKIVRRLFQLNSGWLEDVLPRADPERGGQGVRNPPEKSQKNIGLYNNTGPDPLKKHKATKPSFNVGPSSACQGNSIKMTFCWRADVGPHIVAFGSSLLSSTKKWKTKQKKRCKSWNPSGKTFWIRACLPSFFKCFESMKLLSCTRCHHDNTTDSVASLTAKLPECCSYCNDGVHEPLFSFSVIFCTPKARIFLLVDLRDFFSDLGSGDDKKK